eukprot:7467839-Pyramimonas_sp.AAC.1
MIGGDFNFALEGGGRQCGDGSGWRPGDRYRHDMFHSFFPRWTEAHRPDPARREIVSGAICYVSRLDRLYLASPTAVLSDFSIACSVIGKATTTHNVSDHIP